MYLNNPDFNKNNLIFYPNSKLKQISKSNLNDGGGDEESWNRQLVKPDDQLDLTEAELSEEVPKVLSSDNTNVSRNLVIYSFKEGGFVLVLQFVFCVSQFHSI